MMSVAKVFLVLASCLSLSVGQQRALQTVREIDFSAYLGRWYQTHANLYSTQTFEKDGFCNTATYGLYPNNTISVLNKQTLGGPTGPLDVIYGYAFVPDLYDPGKLLVDLQTGFNDVAPYWIVKLGPKELQADGTYQYQYSIVTDNLSAFLFVLARDVEEFRQEYQDEVLLWLNENGFTRPLNKPVESYQRSDCVYD
ncbi:uncharacterized protein [Ptychodera flava]|uniref:uncharacterized protein n=1 Tax=Ptychodera flava TaxID=63121 RepID=UPI00396AA5BF